MTVFVMLLLAPVCLLVGCGSPPEVQEIEGMVATSGTVTFDGQPLANSEIMFIDPDAQRPMPVVGEIRNGQFETRAPLGLMRVEIRARSELTGDDELTPVFDQLIPARYNERSELSAELAADAPNVLSFELESGSG